MIFHFRYWKSRKQVESWFENYFEFREEQQKKAAPTPTTPSSTPFFLPSGFVPNPPSPTAAYYYNAMLYWQHKYELLLKSCPFAVTSLENEHNSCAHIDSCSEVADSCTSSSVQLKAGQSPGQRKRERKNQQRRQKGSKRRDSGRKSRQTASNTDDVTNDDEEEEVYECHMEISEQMLDFFEQSAKHRKHRGQCV